MRFKIHSFFCFLFAFSFQFTRVKAQETANMAAINQNPSISYATHFSENTTVNMNEKESARNNISATLEEHIDGKEADFRANKGQWKSPALFRMDAPQMRVQFLDHAIEFGQTFGETPESQVGYLWNWTFINGNRKAEIVANKAKGGSNFIISSEKSTFVPRNGEIWYDQIYYNIDVRFYGMAKTEFLYDFILYPYADITEIKIEIGGCKNWFIDAQKELITEFENGKLARHAPQAYQYINGKKEMVSIEYSRTDEGYLTYTVGKYDQSLPLVVH